MRNLITIFACLFIIGSISHEASARGFGGGFSSRGSFSSFSSSKSFSSFSGRSYSAPRPSYASPRASFTPSYRPTYTPPRAVSRPSVAPVVHHTTVINRTVYQPVYHSTVVYHQNSMMQTVMNWYLISLILNHYNTAAQQNQPQMANYRTEPCQPGFTLNSSGTCVEHHWWQFWK